jgi:hypothetical protein
MKILYGQDLSNSVREICDLVKERLWIAVPYIGNLAAVKRILGTNWVKKPNVSFRLIMDVNELSNFNSDTIDFFKNLGELKHLVGLHAKIYIMDECCLLTSANLTSTAFTKRHEIGILLKENEASDAIQVFRKMWMLAKKPDLTKINKIVSRRGSSDEEKAGQEYPVLWQLPEVAEKVNYWLKPIGSTESPITNDRMFTKSPEDLHFSKRKPKSVKPNDILIGYGVGAKRILSVYRVIDDPIHMDEEEFTNDWQRRWPWYVSAENLTKQFGKDWTRHNLYASDLVDEYLAKNPNGFITKVKGKTLGALNYKQDKINLDPDFARFIINKVITAQNGNIKINL